MSDKIFKNTMLLYFRMFLIMAVDLFLLRFLLDILGVEDYGIFNIVGGVVIAFSFLSNTMVSSTQRFFSFEIGKENKKRSKVFIQYNCNNICVFCHNNHFISRGFWCMVRK